MFRRLYNLASLFISVSVCAIALWPGLLWAHGDSHSIDPDTVVPRLYLPAVMSSGLTVDTVSEQLTGTFQVWQDLNDDLAQFDISQFVLASDAGDKPSEQITLQLDSSIQADLLRYDQRQVSVVGYWTGGTETLMQDGGSARQFHTTSIQAEDAEPLVEAADWAQVDQVLSAALQNVAGQGPETVGQWSNVVELPEIPIHATLMPNGKVLF